MGINKSREYSPEEDLNLPENIFILDAQNVITDAGKAALEF